MTAVGPMKEEDEGGSGKAAPRRGDSIHDLVPAGLVKVCI